MKFCVNTENKDKNILSKTVHPTDTRIKRKERKKKPVDSADRQQKLSKFKVGFLGGMILQNFDGKILNFVSEKIVFLFQNKQNLNKNTVSRL